MTHLFYYIQSIVSYPSAPSPDARSKIWRLDRHILNSRQTHTHREREMKERHAKRGIQSFRSSYRIERVIKRKKDTIDIYIGSVLYWNLTARPVDDILKMPSIKHPSDIQSHIILYLLILAVVVLFGFVLFQLYYSFDVEFYENCVWFFFIEEKWMR